jgi:small subunit ribosomal protein S17
VLKEGIPFKVSDTRKRQKLMGEIVSDKMDKTVVVKVTKKVPHPAYHKYVKRSKKYLAHLGAVDAKVGNIVEISAIPPKSKNKHWQVSRVLR